MNRGGPPRPEPSAIRDADRSRPAAWRWVAFWTLVLMVLSLWIPVQASGSGAAGGAFTPLNGLLLAVLVGLAVWVVPAPGRIRLWIAGLLVASTLLAWLLAGPIRKVTGMPPSAPPDAPTRDAGTTGGA